MRNIVIGISCALVLSISGCNQKTQEKSVVKTVKVQKARAYGEAKSLSFPGKVKAASEVKLAFRISGPIARLYVREGQLVGKGEVLAEMDSRDYALQLAATEAEYRQIKAEAERVIRLYEQNSVSENDYDKARLGLQQITAKYEAHKNAVADTKLRAPFSGYIQKRYFDSNETVAAGMPVFSMISSSSPEVEINIPASEYIRREDFEAFTCNFQLYPAFDFPLELISINHKANLNQLYTLRLRFRELPGTTLPSAGMTTMVNIAYKRQSSGLVSLPLSAMFQINDSPTVWIYNEAQQSINARAITVSEITNDGRIIISKGLEAGEQVVTAGVHFLSEGEKVKLLPQAEKTNIGGLL